ncbi:MAG: hypothetical protein K0B81_05745 [Candidatus Cloacimonetes bacterium]|nr:hypothetical protein [Candidatus Cloacimonadota bacterium]
MEKKDYLISKIRIIVSSLLLILILSGCSLFIPRRVPKEELLLAHLQSWERFQLDGIAEISVSQFRLRKNIFVIKTHETLNISLFDSGLFGLRPTPFLSIEIDSLVSLNLPAGIDLMMEDIPTESDFLTVKKFNDLLETLKNNSRIIVRDGRFELNNVEFVFNDKMQINLLQYIDDESEIRVQFQYKRDDQLDRINLFVDNNRLVEIIVDSIRYG